MSAGVVERQSFSVHPVADLFPLMSEAELNDLAEDISTYGLREPIWLHLDGRVIDGRNRVRACQIAGVKPKTQVYADSDHTLVPFVVSLNMKRRHLNESQRAMVAAKIANLPNHRPEDKSANRPTSVSQPEAAQMMNVGVRSVGRAQAVQEHAVPELVAAVERGEVSVNSAADLAREPASLQRAALQSGSVTRIAREAKEAREQTRRPEAERVEQIRAMAERGHTAVQIARSIGIGEERVRELSNRNGVEITAEKVMGKVRRLDSNRIVSQTVLQVAGIGGLFKQIDYAALNRDDLGEWVSSLSESINALTRLRNKLKELSNE